MTRIEPVSARNEAWRRGGEEVEKEEPPPPPAPAILDTRHGLKNFPWEAKETASTGGWTPASSSDSSRALMTERYMSNRTPLPNEDSPLHPRLDRRRSSGGLSKLKRWIAGKPQPDQPAVDISTEQPPNSARRNSSVSNSATGDMVAYEAPQPLTARGGCGAPQSARGPREEVFEERVGFMIKLFKRDDQGNTCPKTRHVEEWSDVAEAFNRTMEFDNFQITEVFRIDNPKLRKQFNSYVEGRVKACQKDPNTKPLELLDGFHVSRARKERKIADRGFACGKGRVSNGVVWFSNRSDYHLHLDSYFGYHRACLLCALADPEPIKPMEYIIRSDAQALPLYFIKYRLLPLKAGRPVEISIDPEIQRKWDEWCTKQLKKK